MPPLVADGALQALADVRTARRAGAMGGKDHHLVRELQIEAAQGLK